MQKISLSCLFLAASFITVSCGPSTEDSAAQTLALRNRDYTLAELIKSPCWPEMVVAQQLNCRASPGVQAQVKTTFQNEEILRFPHNSGAEWKDNYAKDARGAAWVRVIGQWAEHGRDIEGFCWVRANTAYIAQVPRC